MSDKTKQRDLEETIDGLLDVHNVPLKRRTKYIRLMTVIYRIGRQDERYNISELSKPKA